MAIKILPDESVSIFGMKGSGKTTLMKGIISLSKPRGTHRIVILDTKQVGDFIEYPQVEELKLLHKIVENNPIVVYAPNKFEKRDPTYHEGFFAWCYDRWNTRVVIDELTSIVSGNDVPDSYKDVTDRGRAKNVTVIQGNQKPIYVPHSALSEADHFFVFDLLVGDDRDKLAKNLGPKIKIRPRDPHGFWYYHKHLKEPVYFPGLKI